MKILNFLVLDYIVSNVNKDEKLRKGEVQELF